MNILRKELLIEKTTYSVIGGLDLPEKAEHKREREREISRSHDAEDRFGGLAEESVSTT